MNDITQRDPGDECECLNCQRCKLVVLFGPVAGQLNLIDKSGDMYIFSTPAVAQPPQEIKVNWPEGWTEKDLRNATKWTSVGSIGYG